MDIHIEEKGPGVALMQPRFPRLDAVAAPEFRAFTRERLGGFSLVVIDMSHVAAADSTGLGALIGVLKCLPAGGHIRLVGASESVKTLLRLTRLDRVLRSFATVDEALSPAGAAS